jgi:hypothetical protein
MPLLLPIVFAPLMFKNHYLREASVLDYFRLDRNTFNQRLSDLRLISIREQEHLIEDDIFTDLAGDFLHSDYMAGPGFVLPAAGLENGIHEFKPPKLALSDFLLLGYG